jgi:hypothetical protein
MDNQDLIIIRNRICDRITHLEAQKKRQTRIAALLKNSDSDQRIAKANEKLTAIKTGLDEAVEELRSLREDSRPFLESLREERHVNSQKYYEHEKLKNVAKARQTVSDQKKKDATYKGCRKERRAHNWDKKKHRIYKNKLYRAVDTVPDYMKQNLKNMNNNKAYKWRGVCFYGLKPPVKDEPSLCFDRSRRGTQLIHVYEDHNNEFWKYTCKEKGKDKQISVIEEKVVPKIFGNLKDYPPPGAIPIKYGRPCRNRDQRNGRKNNNKYGKNKKGQNGRKRTKKTSGWKDSRPKNEMQKNRSMRKK